MTSSSSSSSSSSELLILSGTSEDLKSPSALKILVAACYARVSLQRRVEETSAEAAEAAATAATALPPPPSSSFPPVRSKKSPSSSFSSSSSLILTHGERVRLDGRGYAAIRYLSGAAASAAAGGGGLSGSGCPADGAAVDAWCSFVRTGVEPPLRVLRLTKDRGDGGGSPSKRDWDDAVSKLDRHLLYRTYLVGSAPTAADIVLAVALQEAVTAGVWDCDDASGAANLSRWYHTVTRQDWFVRAEKALPAVSAAVGPPAAAGAVGGVQRNGVPTAVTENLYRRHRVRIKELLSAADRYANDTVTVSGWARTVRKQSGKLFFVELNDGSAGQSLQCVLHEPDCSGFQECKSSGGTGASFQFVGTLVASQGAGQAYEMQVSAAVLLGPVMAGNLEGTATGGMFYPMSKKEHTLEHLRDHAHLRSRAAVHAAAMRIRHAAAYATHHFFHSHGFLYIHTPIVTAADCEGAGEQFAVTTMLSSDAAKTDVRLPIIEPPEEKKLTKSEQKKLKKKQQQKVDPNKPVEEKVVGAVDYSKDFFGRRVNLTVSGQLNVETHACALSDVYTFGPTFRAEESYTSRHLSEFWMIEPEICFADLTDDINLAEDYLKYCVKFALEHCAADLEFFETNPHGEPGLRDRLRNVLDNPFKRLTYTQAIEILKKAVEVDGVQFEVKPEWGIDLPSEHERYICEKVYKQPVVLTDYPKNIKAFYMKVNDDGKTVAAADVLVPKIGEIIGGSQREHRLDVLKDRCVEMGLDPRAVWWYLDLRRYGTVPHAGFGLGFERMILFLTGLANIRDVVPFPRWPGNAKF